jgi:hypothetical protein
MFTNYNQVVREAHLGRASSLKVPSWEGCRGGLVFFLTQSSIIATTPSILPFTSSSVNLKN